MADRIRSDDMGDPWADVVEAMRSMPKPRHETILMNDSNWTIAKKIFAKPSGFMASPFLLATNIPVEIETWATMIYLVPDSLLPVIRSFRDRFGGPATDQLLRQLADPKRESEVADG